MVTTAVRGVARAAIATGIIMATARAPASADDAAMYRALAERLAQNGGGTVPVAVDLVPGAVAQLPVPVALPSQWMIVGTVTVRPSPSNDYGVYRYTRYTVFFSTTGDAKAVADAVAAGFKSVGYESPQRPGGPGGYVSGSGFVNNTSVNLILCRKENDPAIAVRVGRNGERIDGTIDETLPVATAPGGGTACGASARLFSVNPALRLPQLQPFGDLQVQLRSSNSSGNAVSQLAMVASALPARDILGGWAKQLASQGWIQDGSVANERGGMLLFRSGDASETLMLSLLSSGSHQYSSVLAANRKPPEVKPATAAR